MELRIGIAQTAREIVIELPKALSVKDVKKLIESGLKDDSGLFELVDTKGRSTLVNANRVTYIQLGGVDDSSQIGFGS